MIVFDPFWQLLEERKISTYDLEYEYGFNPAEISRLKRNHNYTLKSIDRFCEFFSCQPSEIILYRKSDDILVPSDYTIKKHQN